MLSTGDVVPIPTLLPDTEIGELPTLEVPVKTGTVPEVPLPVTVCPATQKTGTTISAAEKTAPLARICISFIAFSFRI